MPDWIEEGIPPEERQKRRYVKRGETWERGERERTPRKREPSTEKQRNHFRERIDYTFQDWTKQDWKQIHSLRDMRMELDLHRDSEGRPTLSTRATLTQSRLAWETGKGYTHHVMPNGTRTYETKRYGIVSRAKVLWNDKIYRKGQFLPKAYRDVKY